MVDGSVSEVDEQFLMQLLEGDRPGASKLVRNYLRNRKSVTELYENVIRKALYRVGELWEFNKITVAEEHTATSITEAVMNELYGDIISRERLSRKAVLACVEHETHQVGIKMAADVFEMKGWDTFFPGANTPLPDLVRYMDKVQPDLLALSLSVYFHLPALKNMLQHIRQVFPELPVIIGGQAFRYGGKEIAESYSHTTYISNLPELELFIENFMNDGQTNPF